MQKKIKVSPGNMEIRGGFKPSTFDAVRNTVEVVWTTGARVKRYSYFDGEYYEELSVKKAHVNLDRLNSGAPLLNNHNNYDLRDVIGVVEDAKIKDGVGIATVRLSSRDEVKGIVEDIKNGIIRNISVGYRVNRYEELKEKVEGAPVLRAVDWLPMELSFVGIPADAAAQARNAKTETMECEVVQEEKEGVTMDVENQPAAVDLRQEEVPAPTVQPEAAPAPVTEQVAPPAAEVVPAAQPGEAETRSGEVQTPDAEAIRKQAMDDSLEIRRLVKVASLTDEFADKLLTEKLTVEDARKEIFKELEKRTGSKINNYNVEVNNMSTPQKERQDAFQRAVLAQTKPEQHKVEGANPFMQGSLQQMIRKYLALSGVSEAHDMNITDLVGRALHHTSDFPLIFANTANKSLREGYDSAPSTFMPFVRVRTAKDFKEITSIMLSKGGTLKEVNEHGEYEKTSLVENGEKYVVKKYGLRIGKTYEMIVNDDMDALSIIPSEMGRRAKEKENEIFWSLIIANGNLSDGQPFFSAAHNNVISAGAIAVGSLGQHRKAMRLMRDLDGELINLNMSWLVVPAELETIGEQFVSQNILAETPGNTNPFYNKLKLLVEPRLDASSTSRWYTCADKGQLPMGEMASLQGKGPETFIHEPWSVDGMEIKVRHHFGMKLIDPRAAIRNG
jgi:phage head maturation protease